MTPLAGRKTRSAFTNRVKIKFFGCFAFTLAACFGCVDAHAQKVALSSMTFVCSPDPIYVNASAMCTAHVVGANIGPVTGSVSLYLGSQLLATIPLDSNGDAVASTASLAPAPGIYVVTAVYSGDGEYLSTQRDMALTVYSGQVVITAETLVCSPFAVFDGNLISCKMHIPGGATGTVSFTIAGSVWASATVDQNGDAVVYNGLQGAIAGDYLVAATYSGDSNFASATASTTAVAVPFKPDPSAMSIGCSPAPLVVGNNGSCTVLVSGGVTGNVDLYIHDQYQTTAQLDSSGAATISNLFGTLSTGSYSVRAVYTGNSNFDVASAATTININTGAETPTLTIACNPTTLSPGSGTNCTAQAPVGATGSILFYIGANEWTSVPLDGNGQAMAIPTPGKDEWDLSFLPVGSYSVVAYYPGDQNFSSTSAGVTVTIQTTKPVPGMSVSCTPSALVTGNLATCAASVGQGATGPVLFGLQGQPNTGLSLDPKGNVVFQNQLAGASPGSYTLQASYAGDINFAPASASTTVTVSSQKVTPTMNVSVSPTVVSNGAPQSISIHVSGGATGTVELNEGGYATVTLPLDFNGSFAGGSHVSAGINGPLTLTFTYSGDANYSSVTQSSGGSTSCAAQVVGATSGTISLYLDGSLQGTNGVDSTGSVVIVVPSSVLTSGPHTVSASYFLADQTLSSTATQSISVGSGSTQPPSSGYSYSITDSNGNSGYTANGNITAYTDSVNGQWALGYDNLNRLTSAATSTNNYCWAYDSFGNRTAQGSQSTACPTPGSPIPSGWTQMAVSAGNQLVGTLDSNGNAIPLYSYDSAGNMLFAPGDNNILNAVLYDGEGRVCATRQSISAGLYSQTQYIYDAEGNHVAEGIIQDWTNGCDITQNGFQQTKAYIVGSDGEQMTELSVDANESFSWVHTNVYANSQLIATYANDNGGTTPQTGSLHFFLSDWLGTKRLQTDYAGNTENTWSNLPFGDGLAPSGTGVSEQHFTGKERDAESGLDYFGARYYASSAGHWMSPDWSAKIEPVPYAKLANPQSLNLYSYVENNPITGSDPDGHYRAPWLGGGGTNVGGMMGGSGSIYAAEQEANQLFAEQVAQDGKKAQQQSGCNCGTNHHFHTQNQAATAALKAIFPTSEDQLAEYGGRIYMNPDGKTYSYTTPVTQGQNGTVDPDAGQGMGNRLPAGTASAGEYHTHPDTLAHCCGQEGFSGQDGQRAVNQHIPTYIMAPSGTIYKLDGTHSSNYMTAPQSSWPANGPIP
jgi:RHS repeat-associated protein